jgi:uncharacterized membrane protein
MIDVIFAIKFVHVLAAGVMFGTWLCIAVFMVLAHRSTNTAVVALTAQFVVSAELAVMTVGFAAQAVSGLPLAWAIGLAPFSEFWIVVSLGLFAVILLCWIAALRIEMRIRGLARQAALNAVPLPASYRRLFQWWCVFAVPLLAGMLAVYALMIWQPRLD